MERLLLLTELLVLMRLMYRIDILLSWELLLLFFGRFALMLVSVNGALLLVLHDGHVDL
jgi:hypothetical protein